MNNLVLGFCCFVRNWFSLLKQSGKFQAPLMTAARGELIPLDKQWRTWMHSRVNSHRRKRLEGRRSVCRQCLQTAGNSRSSMLAGWLFKSSADLFHVQHNQTNPSLIISLHQATGVFPRCHSNLSARCQLIMCVASTFCLPLFCQLKVPLWIKTIFTRESLKRSSKNYNHWRRRWEFAPDCIFWLLIGQFNVTHNATCLVYSGTKCSTLPLCVVLSFFDWESENTQ